MTMTPVFRKFALTAHITFSVGWFGAVAAFLTLAIAGLTSQDTQIIRSAYISMELVGWFVIVPACLGALISGLVQSLGTPWGLFRYYWVLVKFILTIIATIILFLHMQPISYIEEVASKTTFSDSELLGLRIQLVADAGAALLVLLVTTTLSVYKPWGQTGYGHRTNQEQNKRFPKQSTTGNPWGLYMLLALICLGILLFVVLHLIGVMGGH